jgi:hypothetical protein
MLDRLDRVVPRFLGGSLLAVGPRARLFGAALVILPAGRVDGSRPIRARIAIRVDVSQADLEARDVTDRCRLCGSSLRPTILPPSGEMGCPPTSSVSTPSPCCSDHATQSCVRVPPRLTRCPAGGCGTHAPGRTRPRAIARTAYSYRSEPRPDPSRPRTDAQLGTCGAAGMNPARSQGECVLASCSSLELRARGGGPGRSQNLESATGPKRVALSRRPSREEHRAALRWRCRADRSRSRFPAPVARVRAVREGFARGWLPE